MIGIGNRCWMGWMGLMLLGCASAPPPEPASEPEPPVAAPPGPAAPVEAAPNTDSEPAGEPAPAETAAPESEPAAAPAPPESRCARELAKPKDRVLFPHEGAKIPKGEQPFLEEVAKAVTEAKGTICLEILGSADPSEEGKAAWMSGTRARVVAKALQTLGVARVRMKHVVGYSADDAFKPDDTCTDEEREKIRAHNRRAKVVQIPCP